MSDHSPKFVYNKGGVPCFFVSLLYMGALFALADAWRGGFGVPDVEYWLSGVFYKYHLDEYRRAAFSLLSGLILAIVCNRSGESDVLTNAKDCGLGIIVFLPIVMLIAVLFDVIPPLFGAEPFPGAWLLYLIWWLAYFLMALFLLFSVWETVYE